MDLTTPLLSRLDTAGSLAITDTPLRSQTNPSLCDICMLSNIFESTGSFTRIPGCTEMAEVQGRGALHLHVFLWNADVEL